MGTRLRKRARIGASIMAVSAFAAVLLSPGRTSAQAPSPSPSSSSSPSVLETPSPQASPTPSTTPTAIPSSLPSSTLLPRPIRLDRARVGIVPGGSLAINVSGGVGTLVARSSDPSVDASYDAISHQLLVRARTPGNATVSLLDGVGDAASVDVLVAPPAGFVPANVTVNLGGNVSPAFAVARVNDEIARQAQMQPKTTIDIHGIAIPATIHPGDRVDVSARVRIDGAGAFVDALGTTNVHVRVDAYPRIDPSLLLYSDDPERLDAAADGVVYRATIDAAHSARAYVYHVSDTPARRLYLVLQSATGPARVRLLGYAAGPENAFSFVGHRATIQYLLERGAQESVVLDVTPETPLVVPLGARAMRAGDLVAAIFDLHIEQGDTLSANVVAVSGDRNPLEVLDAPELGDDGHGRRGEFSLVGVPPLALTYGVGSPDTLPFSIGEPTIANVRPNGRALGGDYGVLREVALQLNNPTNAPATVYLYETPAGGNATTTMWFTGDPTPTEISCVRGGPGRYAVKSFVLAPSETRVVTGEYMTDGTSYFPLLFGLTQTPPSPPPGPYSPDACTPKTPPVTPTS